MVTGTVFTRWTTVADVERGPYGRPHVPCRCECGTERVVFVGNLTRGLSKSCGCLSREVQRSLHTTIAPVATGAVFGDLTVLGPAPQAASRKRNVRCRCACGRECVRAIYTLLSGEVRSCGCGSKRAALRHGHARTRAETATYRSWRNMIARCTWPDADSWQYYGGRGIRVCDAWRGSFEQFLADLGPRPDGRTLDRIDTDGHYEPGNVRWATPKEQARTRRQPRR